MTLETLDGQTLAAMIISGAHHLTNNADHIDALNVFPVPDGDTGTNMNLSMTSGVQEVQKITSNDVSEVAKALAKGLLMGARGNSGVILSQIFRGFSQGLEGQETIDAVGLASAFSMGVETAYKAVMKPVEGTILTVAKDTAKVAEDVAKTEKDIIILIEEVLEEAKQSLKRTPELLPVLKEVGVVDSGGQGLVTIYEGFLASLKGEELPEQTSTTIDMEEMINAEHHKIAQDFMDTSEIEYGYCTEFMVTFDPEKLTNNPFDEAKFRTELADHGDSLLVVSDEEVVKIHIHTEYPGNTMNLAQQYGDLINIDIENMREQHTSLVGAETKSTATKKDDYAIITVAMGAGIKELLESLGATVVISGGQTMNPSTQDLSNAIKKANAHQAIILPNNKNIVMAAEQAAEMAEEEVRVINTATIPQGISALLAFHSDASIDDNYERMSEMIADVKSGEITYAVRDTEIDGMMIKKGNFMGIADSKIKASHQERSEAVHLLLEELITDEDEIVTLIYGEDVLQEEVTKLVEKIENQYENIELEVYDGKQPIYSYILAVE